MQSCGKDLLGSLKSLIKRVREQHSNARVQNSLLFEIGILLAQHSHIANHPLTQDNQDITAHAKDLISAYQVCKFLDSNISNLHNHIQNWRKRFAAKQEYEPAFKQRRQRDTIPSGMESCENLPIVCVTAPTDAATNAESTTVRKHEVLNNLQPLASSETEQAILQEVSIPDKISPPAHSARSQVILIGGDREALAETCCLVSNLNTAQQIVTISPREIESVKQQERLDSTAEMKTCGDGSSAAQEVYLYALPSNNGETLQPARPVANVSTALPGVNKPYSQCFEKVIELPDPSSAATLTFAGCGENYTDSRTHFQSNNSSEGVSRSYNITNEWDLWLSNLNSEPDSLREVTDTSELPVDQILGQELFENGNIFDTDADLMNYLNIPIDCHVFKGTTTDVTTDHVETELDDHKVHDSTVKYNIVSGSTPSAQATDNIEAVKIAKSKPSRNSHLRFINTTCVITSKCQNIHHKCLKNKPTKSKCCSQRNQPPDTFCFPYAIVTGVEYLKYCKLKGTPEENSAKKRFQVLTKQRSKNFAQQVDDLLERAGVNLKHNSASPQDVKRLSAQVEQAVVVFDVENEEQIIVFDERPLKPGADVLHVVLSDGHYDFLKKPRSLINSKCTESLAIRM
jgi:hypothetical protein